MASLQIHRKSIKLKKGKNINANNEHTDTSIMEESGSTLNVTHDEASTPVFNPREEEEY